FRADDMDDTLTGLIDIEHGNAVGRCFDPKTLQQFLAGLSSARPPARGGNGVIRRCKCQLGIVDRKLTVLEVEQAPRAAEIVQQMPIDVKKVRIATDASNDVLVPDLFQEGPAALLQSISSLCGTRYPPLSAVWHGLVFEGFGPRPCLYQSTTASSSARAPREMTAAQESTPALGLSQHLKGRRQPIVPLNSASRQKSLRRYAHRPATS